MKYVRKGEGEGWIFKILLKNSCYHPNSLKFLGNENTVSMANVKQSRENIDI